MDRESLVKNFKDKKILILGLGREGRDSFLFFRKLFPEKTIGLADRLEKSSLPRETKKIISRGKKIDLHCGRDYLKSLAQYDVVVKSPGIPVHLPPIEIAAKKGKITSQTAIFLKYCPGVVVGVTGTKGKSTTAALIYAILKRAGKRARLLGNIGVPVLTDLLVANNGDNFVLELSSHQLYYADRSPHIAVLLNLYPEHLDYYRDFSEYARAKANIMRFQTKKDFLVYNAADRRVSAIAKKSKAKTINFNNYPLDVSEKIGLIGAFNQRNAKAAASVGRILKIGQKTISEAIASFKPLEHRLELVATVNGARFYDDALSTIQESAVAAIDAFGREVETLIAGGFDRGQPHGRLAKKILDSDIRTLILFPTTGSRIWRELASAAKKSGRAARRREIKHHFAGNMEEAVRMAVANTGKGRVCLMSCAASSFSIFKDYREKGSRFRECLERYARRRPKK